MITKVRGAAAGILIGLAACSGSGEPSPSAIDNPIVFHYRGLTVADAINVVSKAANDLGLQQRQADPSGLYETRPIDVAAYVKGFDFTAYSNEERQVFYKVEVTPERGDTSKLAISALYRPIREGISVRGSDRPVPAGHPGRELAGRFDTRIRAGLAATGGEVLEDVEP